MKTISKRVLAACVLSLAVLGTSSAAIAVPVQVNVRVEGKTQTLFEGTVTTDAKEITTPSSQGPHACDIVNNGGFGSPKPTPTAALDSAAQAGGFTWDGTYGDGGFPDFLVKKIGPDEQTATEFWAYAVNYIPPPNLGGCQFPLSAGSEVLWAYDAFTPTFAFKPILKLSAPTAVGTGESATVTVTDGETGAPVAGAAVGGVQTGSDGKAKLTFESPGLKKLKAEKVGSIRSNGVEVCVHAGSDGTCGTVKPAAETPKPGCEHDGEDGRCGTADRKPPVARVASLKYGKKFKKGKGPRVLSGVIDEVAGIRSVKLSILRRYKGRCYYFNGQEQRFIRSKRCGKQSFFDAGSDSKWSYLLPKRLASGRYTIKVTAVDTSGNGDLKFQRGRNLFVINVS